MGSVYDNTNNIYTTKYDEVILNNSGHFNLGDHCCKELTIFNDAGYKVNCNFVTDPGKVAVANTSGTCSAEGVQIGVEDGISLRVRGIGNTQVVAIQKAVHTSPTMSIKYIVEC